MAKIASAFTNWLLLTACIVASTIPQEPRWDLKVVAKPYSLDALGLDSEARQFPMMNADGRRFNCYVASSADKKLPSENVPESRAMQARMQLERHHKMCLTKNMGYWTYELCVGETVKQFRKDPTDGTSAPASGVTHSFSLGSYQEASDVVVSPEGLMMLQQSYTEGTEGRSATVQYDCDAGLALKGSVTSITYEITSIVEPEPKQYIITVAVRDPAVCNLLPSPTRIMAPLNNTCIEHVEGWWTYEICLGGKLRQYHNEGGGKAVQESLIGSYDPSHGQKLQLNSLGNNAAIVQTYNQGTPCDVRNGRPREAQLRFECTPSGASTSTSSTSAGTRTITLTLVSIRESPTCEYTITFGTPLVCEHPDAAPAQHTVRAPPPRPVMCVPEAEDEEDDGDGAAVDGHGDYAGSEVQERTDAGTKETETEGVVTAEEASAAADVAAGDRS